MENDKNRVGEKTTFVERANEDIYFAVKEHELIEGMKAEFQKVESARREGRIVNCPKCPGKLESYKFMDFVLDRCESCEGIWLDKDQLKGILRKAARVRWVHSLIDASPKMKPKRRTRRKHPVDNAWLCEGAHVCGPALTAPWIPLSGKRTSRESFTGRKTMRSFGLEGKPQGLVRGFQKLKADALAACGGNLFQISPVQLRQQNTGNPGAFCRQHFFFNPSYRQYQTAQTDLAGHGDIFADAPSGQTVRRGRRRA